MLDPQILRKDLDLLKNNISRRGLDIDINYLVEQDEKEEKLNLKLNKLGQSKKILVKRFLKQKEPKKKNF